MTVEYFEDCRMRQTRPDGTLPGAGFDVVRSSWGNGAGRDEGVGGAVLALRHGMMRLESG